MKSPGPGRMDEGLLIAAVLDSTTVVAHATSTAGANLRFHFPWRARMMSCNFLQRGSRDFLSNSNFTPLLLFPKSAQVVHFETRATLVTNEKNGRVGTTRQTRPFL